MPGLDGEKLLRVRGAHPDRTAVPFLFITATHSVERRTRLLEQGACDALTKPFHPPDLVARLRLHLQIKQLQDELLIKNQRLEELSSTDELTGLRTRRAVLSVLEKEVDRAQRYGTPMCVVMADLDHFKAVNDLHGHLAGDEVLRTIAARIQSRLRSTDVVGRYGGEEFLIVLAHNDLEGAAVAARSWCAGISSEPVTLEDGTELKVSMSIGVAAFSEGVAASRDLIAAADAALYRAKENGRNRVELHED
jgi:diguanylate cyclase (GGDEF)-like protein